MMRNNTDCYYIIKAFIAAFKPSASRWINYRVGAVLVKDKKILGKANNNIILNLHAEEKIIRNLSPKQIRGSTLYTTLPPCVDRKIGESCAKLIIRAKIKRLVCLLDRDYNHRIADKGLAEIKAAGIKVDVIHAPKLRLAYILLNFPAIIFLVIRSKIYKYLKRR